jgi:hypothetical protein
VPHHQKKRKEDKNMFNNFEILGTYKDPFTIYAIDNHYQINNNCIFVNTVTVKDFITAKFDVFYNFDNDTYLIIGHGYLITDIPKYYNCYKPINAVYFILNNLPLFKIFDDGDDDDFIDCFDDDEI